MALIQNARLRESNPSQLKAGTGGQARAHTNLQPTTDATNPLGRQSVAGGQSRPQPLPTAGGLMGKLPAPTPGKASTPPTSFPGSVTSGAAPSRYGGGMVSRAAAAIVDSSHPLMQAAMTRGKQYAESRGLLNSSLGAEASGRAVVDMAAQLGAQDVAAAQTAEGQRIQRQGLLMQEKGRSEALTETQRQFDANNSMDRARLHLSAEVAARELSLNQKRFESDEARRDWVQRMEHQQLRLAQEQQAFRQQLDLDKFKADENYRQKALEQADRLATKQIELDWERLGLETKRLTVDKQISILNLDRALIQTRADIYNAISGSDVHSDDEKKSMMGIMDKYIGETADAGNRIFGTALVGDADEEEEEEGDGNEGDEGETPETPTPIHEGGAGNAFETPVVPEPDPTDHLETNDFGDQYDPNDPNDPNHPDNLYGGYRP